MGRVIRENDKQVSVYFDSLLELMDYVPPEINAEKFNEYIGKIDVGRNSRSWYGPTNRNAKETINHALLGDDVLYDNLANKIKILDKAVGANTTDYVQNIKTVKRKKIKAEFGDELDIHKVYQGQCQTAWTRTQRIEQDSKHHLVTILVDYVGNCNESAEDSLWRAAVAVKLVNDLLVAGKSVKLMCGSVTSGCMKGNRKLLTTSIVIKNYNERLSLPRMSAMTSLGFFRSAGFAMLCSQHRETVSSLGRSVDMSDNNMPIHLKDDVDAGHTKYVPVGRISSLRDAVTGLKKAYAIMESFR